MFSAKTIPNDKEQQYRAILDDMQYLLSNQDTTISTLSNFSALLNYYMTEINWVGVYLFDGEKLTLGPFQGLPACTLIHLGSGVCGTSAQKRETLVVKDVHTFEGHIACDSHSESEIVVPIVINDSLYGVLDIDAPIKERFNEIDKRYLEKIITKLIDFLR
ncbi:MAG: GAF domain-containing protein [Candidatus Izemoplasma sp.]|nr:GAF domain-containing protein [Candidatus Izemoplasma sp.]